MWKEKKICFKTVFGKSGNIINVCIKHVHEQETIFFRIGNSNNIVIDLQKCKGLDTSGYKRVSFYSEFKSFQ